MPAESQKLTSIRFLRIAEGSANEVETQFIIAKNLKYIDEDTAAKIADEVNQILKMIGGFTKKLKN